MLFLEFLRNNFPVPLHDITLDISRTIWLQLNGAHFHREVRENLNVHFQNRSIGRHKLQNWPLRSLALF